MVGQYPGGDNTDRRYRSSCNYHWCSYLGWKKGETVGDTTTVLFIYLFIVVIYCDADLAVYYVKDHAVRCVQDGNYFLIVHVVNLPFVFSTVRC